MALVMVDPLTGTLQAHDLQQPALRVDDLSAVRGDGVFEAALYRGGTVRGLDLHLDRFERSARLMDLPAVDRGLWREALVRLAADHDVADRSGADATFKWVLSRGVEGTGRPTGWAQSLPISAATERERAAGLALATLSRGFAAGAGQDAPWLLIGAKTLSYAVNLASSRHAAARGADDALWVTTDGYVLEAPRSNVVVARGHTLTTPDPALGLLHGTTQRLLFEWAAQRGWECRYDRLRLPDLHAADAVWLTSSIRTIIPVHRVDGAELRVDQNLTRELAAFLA